MLACARLHYAAVRNPLNYEQNKGAQRATLFGFNAGCGVKQKPRTMLIRGFSRRFYRLVTRTGFEPVAASVKGW